MSNTKYSRLITNIIILEHTSTKEIANLYKNELFKIGFKEIVIKYINDYAFISITGSVEIFEKLFDLTFIVPYDDNKLIIKYNCLPKTICDYTKNILFDKWLYSLYEGYANENILG